MNNKPLKICVLAAANYDHTYVQCRMFKEFGHEVTLVSPNNGPCPEGVTHVACGVEETGGVWAKLKWLKKVYDGVKSVDADVFQVYYAAELTSWMAWLLRKRPLITCCLGGDVLYDEQGTVGPVGRWMTKKLLLDSDYVTAVSNFLGEAIFAFGVRPEKFERVIWGVNHEIFHPNEEENSARETWNIPSGAPVIFSPRQLKRFYNQHVMIDALAEIVQERANAILVLSAFNQEDDYRQELEAQIARLGLVDNVRFAPQMTHQEMMVAYNSADLVLSLPPSDGTPVSVMESMACGTPVVMTDLERFKEFFTHEETGWFTKIDSKEAAKGVLAFLNDPALYKKVKEQGIKLIHEKADLHSQSRLLEEISYRVIAAQ